MFVRPLRTSSLSISPLCDALPSFENFVQQSHSLAPSLVRGLDRECPRKVLKTCRFFNFFQKKSSKHAGFLTFFVIAGRNRLLWDRADQVLCARCGLGQRRYFHHMPPDASRRLGPINFYAPAADLVSVHVFTICLQMLPESSGRGAFMRTLRTW